MGGAPAGDVAAELAIDTVVRRSPQTAVELVAAFEQAHRTVAVRARDAGFDGMGCTLVAVVAGADGDLVVANVGDARAYLWGGGPLVLLTTDHNEAQLLVEAGSLSRADAPSHPASARLTRAVGPRAVPVVDVRTVAAGPHDRVLL